MTDKFYQNTFFKKKKSLNAILYPKHFQKNEAGGSTPKLILQGHNYPTLKPPQGNKTKAPILTNVQENHSKPHSAVPQQDQTRTPTGNYAGRQ